MFKKSLKILVWFVKWHINIGGLFMPKPPFKKNSRDTI